MQTCDPLQARQWFKLREVVNLVAVVIGFIVLDLILWLFFGGFIAGTVSIVVAFCVFFFVLHKRTIGITCPGCGNVIETDTPWICGVCGAENLHTDDFPFVGRCGNEKCRAKPKAYQCHHKKNDKYCGQLIFFTKDRQEINFARCVNFSVSQKQKPVQVKKDEHKEKVVELNKNIELTKLEVDKAKLDAEWKSYKDVLEPLKPKSKAERLRSGVRNRTEVDEEVRRLKAEADKEFANDKKARKRRYLEIEDEAKDLL